MVNFEGVGQEVGDYSPPHLAPLPSLPLNSVHEFSPHHFEGVGQGVGDYFLPLPPPLPRTTAIPAHGSVHEFSPQGLWHVPQNTNEL